MTSDEAMRLPEYASPRGKRSRLGRLFRRPVPESILHRGAWLKVVRPVGLWLNPTFNPSGGVVYLTLSELGVPRFFVSLGSAKPWEVHADDLIPAWECPTYLAWGGFMRRCYAKSCAGFPDYGGRGIRVWRGWHGRAGYLRFRRWVEEQMDGGLLPPKYHIDRRDPNGNYGPHNCTPREAREHLRRGAKRARKVAA